MKEYSDPLRLSALFFLLLLPALYLHGQSGEELDSYAATDPADYGSTLSLLGADGEAEEAPLSLGSLAVLTMERWEPGAGLLYSITGLPRYALRDLRELNVYPEAPQFLAARRPVSGAEALQLLSRAVSAFGDLPPDSGNLPGEPPAPARSAAIYPIFDLTNESRLTLRDEEERFSNELTLSLDGWAPNETTLESEFSLVSDEDEPITPFLRELYLANRLTPAPNGATTEVSFGRRRLTDLTGRVLSLPVDGFLLQRSGPTAVFLFGAGYTGLLREEQGPPPFTLSTREDSQDGGSNLAPPTLLTLLRLTLPERWGRQSPSIELAARIDERSLGDLGFDEDSLDVYLGTLALAGPLSPRIFYDLSLTGQSAFYRANRGDAAREEAFTLGALARGSFRWFPALPAPTRLSLELLLATGDSDGESLLSDGYDRLNTAFLPAGGETPWSLYPGDLTNLFHPRLAADVRVLEPLRLSVGGGPFFRMSRQPVAEIPESALYDELPLGGELFGNVLFEPTRELILELNSSIFFPWTRANGGVYFSNRDPVWETALSLSLAL